MILQSPAPTPWPSPIGPTPYEVFERYFNDGVYKTWGNISPLYQLDNFDYTILLVYFAILGTLAIYGVIGLALLVGSIWFTVATLDSQDLELTTLVAPVPVPQQQNEPKKQEEVKPQALQVYWNKWILPSPISRKG